MCGCVPAGQGGYHASWQACGRLVGVEGKDWADVALQTSSSFWKLIEGRRKEPIMSMNELRTRLKKRKK